VKVKPVEGASYTGRIVSAGADAAQLDVGEARRDVRYDEVATARVEVEFNRRRARSDETQVGEE
jgi:hypothetical protein